MWPKLLFIVWSAWLGTSFVSDARHLWPWWDGPPPGCHFTYTGRSFGMWPMRRTGAVLCWRLADLEGQ